MSGDNPTSKTTDQAERHPDQAFSSHPFDEVAKVGIAEKTKQWDNSQGHHKAYMLGGHNVYEVINNDQTHTKTEIARDMMGREEGTRVSKDGATTSTFNDGFDSARITHARDGSTTVLTKQDDGSYKPVPDSEKEDWLQKEKELFTPPSMPRPQAG